LTQLTAFLALLSLLLSLVPAFTLNNQSPLDA
jgi:hypothetical protein